MTGKDATRRGTLNADRNDSLEAERAVLREAERSLPHGIGALFHRLTERERELVHIQVEVTSACPGACAYCPRGILRDAWKARNMSAACFAALVPLMRRSGRVHLQGWGEPLSHPLLFDFVRLARRAGCAASTTSCGHYMDADRARRLVESGMDIVAFSLAGTDPQSNAVRANVPFANVERAVRTLNAARKEIGSATPQVHFSYILLADRLDALDRLPDLMEAWDVPEAVVSTLDMPVLPEHWKWAYRPEEREKIARARDVLENVAAKAAERGGRVRFCLPGEEGGECREHVGRSAYVDAEGNLSPCIYLNVPFREEDFDRPTCLAGNRRVCGNVLERSPVDIWNDPDYRDFRGDLAHNVPPKTCLSCPKRFERMF